VDGGWSAQFEHTVLITDTGFELITAGNGPNTPKATNAEKSKYISLGKQ